MRIWPQLNLIWIWYHRIDTVTHTESPGAPYRSRCGSKCTSWSWPKTSKILEGFGHNSRIPRFNLQNQEVWHPGITVALLNPSGMACRIQSWDPVCPFPPKIMSWDLSPVLLNLHVSWHFTSQPYPGIRTNGAVIPTTRGSTSDRQRRLPQQVQPKKGWKWTR